MARYLFHLLAAFAFVYVNATYEDCGPIRSLDCASVFRDNDDCETYVPTSYIVYPTQTTIVTLLASTLAITPYTIRTLSAWPTLTTTPTSLPPGPTSTTTIFHTNQLPTSLAACNNVQTLAQVCSCRGITQYNTTTTVTPLSTSTITVSGTDTNTATRTALLEACQPTDNYGYSPASIGYFVEPHASVNFKELFQPNVTTSARCCEACYNPDLPNNGCMYYRWQNNGTLENDGSCYLGIWGGAYGNTPYCYNGDPRSYPGPDSGARNGGMSSDSQYGYGPCLKEAPCYYEPQIFNPTCPY